MFKYIVDKNYHVLQFDEKTKMRFPELQEEDLCYRVFNNANEPCPGCHLCDSSPQKRHYFNKKVQKELDMEFSPLNWAGKEEQILVITREIAPDNDHLEVLERSEETDINAKEIDLLTGLFRYGAFENRTIALLKAHPTDNWCMVAIDIEHFKLFNWWYGEESGDCLLRRIGTYLAEIQEKEPRGCVFGRWGGDDFYALLPEDAALVETIAKDIFGFISGFGNTANFFPGIGVYKIGEPITVRAMLDHARIAVDETKGNYHKRIAWFNDEMLEQMEKQQLLLSEIQRGIQNREFIFYVQPKCNLNTGKIVGMEALTRWNHPTRGLIPPGDYIPFLEKNGLITDLDLYIWEEVCREMRSQLDSGKELLIPMSVNVSVKDLYAINVPEAFKRLIAKYRLPANYLEIEITESAYAEDYDVTRRFIEELHQMGFTVLMDDFGSGYSSLNLLKNINVNMLKIDMKFLDLDDENKERGITVLQSIIRLANLMNLRIIAEGVESREQIDLLLKMGCNYGQGYYFYHPMPIEALKELISHEENVDRRGIRERQITHINASDLFNENVVNDVILNNILGPVVFIEVRNGKPFTTHVNNQYCNVLGMNIVDMEDRRGHLLDYFLEEDRIKLLSGFDEAYENKDNGAECVLRMRRLDDSIVCLAARIYFLREHDDCRQFYVACYDITERHRHEQALNMANDR